MTFQNKLKYIVALTACLVCVPAKADYVLAVHQSKPWCQPCNEMVPTEKVLVKAGCDIRTIDSSDPKNAALVAYYHIKAVPVYIYVKTTAKGDFDSGYRMTGWQPESRLRRFCSSPGVATAGSAVKNIVDVVLNPNP